MKKIAVVYYSMTGNTEAMAEAVREGIEAGGAEGILFTSTDFSADLLGDYNAIAFGCPAMGNEELEDTEFEPLFAACEQKLGNKPIALFGSYEWADGQWMRDWEERCKDLNLNVLATTIAYDHPDDAAQEACRSLGRILAQA